jgi:hypothetical protein
MLEVLKEKDSEKLTYSDLLIKTFLDMIDKNIAELEKTTALLMEENTELKNQVASLQKRTQLQDGLVARLLSKSEQQEAQLTDLRARSMRDNIVFQGIDEGDADESWHDTKIKLQKFLTAEMKIQDLTSVQIDRAHRSGPKGTGPRPIIAKFMNTASKDQIFKNVKHLRGKTKFSVQEQLPAEVTERRKRLWGRYKAAKANPRNKVRWALDKLIINGVTFTADDEKHELSENAIKRKIDTSHTQHKIIGGSTFIGHAAEIKDKDDIPVVLAGLMEDKMIAGATHNMYAYRFEDNSKASRVTEGFTDDGEHGGGHKLLKLIKDFELTNVIVVVTRVFGNQHLGPKRFDYIKDSATEALKISGFEWEENSD